MRIKYPCQNKISFGRILLVYLTTFNIIDAVGSLFGAQAQQVGDSGPRYSRQWICKERVIELGPNEVSVS